MPVLGLTPYFVFMGILLLTAVVMVVFQARTKNNPFKKRFFQNRVWIILAFEAVAVLLTFFRFIGISTLSARALWLPYALALIYLAYISFIELNKKIPEKTSLRELDLLKRRYLRPFKKKK